MKKRVYIKKIFEKTICEYCGYLFNPNRGNQSYGSPVCATLAKSTSGMKFGTECQCGDPECSSFVYSKNNLYKSLSCRDHPRNRQIKIKIKPCELCGNEVIPLYKLHQSIDTFQVCRECMEIVFNLYEGCDIDIKINRDLETI